MIPLLLLAAAITPERYECTHTKLPVQVDGKLDDAA